MNQLPLLAGPGLSLENVLLIALGIFCIGVYGVLSRRNILVILMCLELMLNGANLALVAFARAYLPQDPSGANGSQAFAVMVLAVAAAEAGVGLAILLAAFRRFRTADSGDISLLSG